jgi:hypothetical protein
MKMDAGEHKELRPAVNVAVVVEREAQPNRWEDWRFRIAEVLPDEGGFGREPRLLRDDGKTARWLHPGFTVALYRDECEGYHLNLSSTTCRCRPRRPRGCRPGPTSTTGLSPRGAIGRPPSSRRISDERPRTAAPKGAIRPARRDRA